MENKKFKHFHTDINVSPISLLINCDGWVDYWIGKACDVESFDILVSVVNEYDMQYCFEGKRLEKGNENAWNKIVDKTIPLEEVIKKSRELGKDVINTYLENYSKLKDLSDENVAELFLKLSNLFNIVLIATI